MSALPVLLLVCLNVGLVWVLLAAPLGIRTITMRRTLDADVRRIWSAIDPRGAMASWHPSVLSSEADAARPHLVRQLFRQPDRHGQPTRRLFDVKMAPDDGGGTRFSFDARVVEDSTLDSAFWQDFRETRAVRAADDGGALLTVSQTDRYRGIAVLAYRYVTLRRELASLEGFLATGHSRSGGLFEHPAMQAGLAVLSTLMLWPFFGLNGNGLLISALLTVVIVLHELGHMTAYRAFGHTSARMIFVPLLGGVAIGGRPYNSAFEVATCALMGAGVSAFLVPVVVAAHEATLHGALPLAMMMPLLVLLLIMGSFNLLNLLPMNRFDGGRVLHQVFCGRRMQMAGSFGVTLVILWIGWRVGLSGPALIAALAIFTLMSLIGLGSTAPKDALDEMSPPERLMAGFGLYAALSIHGYAIIYACDRLFP